MLMQGLTLTSHLADGAPFKRSAVVLAAQSEESDGGLARYRLILGPWLQLTANVCDQLSSFDMVEMNKSIAGNRSYKRKSTARGR